MAKRGRWVIGGLAVGVGALVVAPEARMWLRRRLGLEPEDRRWFEDEGAEPAEHEGDEPLDTREARFSLRARLSEDGQGAATDMPAPEPFTAPPPPPAAPEPFAAPPPPPPPPPAREPFTAPPPPAPAPEPFTAPPPSPPPTFTSYETVPPIPPETDEPKTPGEDTNEIEPVPPVNTWEPPAAERPLPPPTPLRSPAPPKPSRPFSGEGASFRSAIDAARERVHGAARDATPDEGDSTEPIEEPS
jgi:hypothetical protein